MKGSADAAHGTADGTLRVAESTMARAEILRACTSRFAEAGLRGLEAGMVSVGTEGSGEILAGASGANSGQGRERMFDAGEIRLVILRLLSSEPSYGYQLIKTMEARLGGGYTPSAGVVYPTLTMLEEEGLIAANADRGQEGL